MMYASYFISSCIKKKGYVFLGPNSVIWMSLVESSTLQADGCFFWEVFR